MPLSVLFVCLGNICRSPMAEGAMKTVAQDCGMPLDIESAGTGAWHVGNPPDERATAAALANGVDISRQCAQQVDRMDFARFDYIVAMDRSVLEDLQTMRPDGSKARLSLLLDHVSGRGGEDIADPYYGGTEGFAVAWADISAGVTGLLETIEGR